MNKVLAVFAKEPTPGLVKTRLAAATSPEFAARVAAACLHDTLDRLTAVHAERWLVHTPDGAGLDEYRTSGWQLCPQGAGDLGQRMQRFVEHHLRSDVHIVLVGADSPTLPVAYVEQAFHDLEKADVVLGPATDGGYYLLGVARRVPAIFDGLAWGTSTVLHETVARLDSSWRLTVLPPWYDIDTLDDWRMLLGHVVALRRMGVEHGMIQHLRWPV